MIEIIRKPQVQGALRHLLTALGPLLAAHGITSDAYWQAGVGAFMAALGFYLSVTAPEKKL
ncbi:Pam3-gp28 family putative phage holin [Pseudooceanicola sp. 502str34]